MITKMAALFCAFYLFHVSYKKIPIYHKTTNSTKCRMLPKSLCDFNPQIDVHFYLFTPYNPDEVHEIYPEKMSSLFVSHFDFYRDTKILIHGWKNAANSTFCETVKDAYLKHMYVNVIVVDWNKLSRHPYNRSCKYMDLVAPRVALLYEFLRKFVPHNSIHIIGHSLGAHIAGIVGKLIKKEKVYRITGLDPAGPLISKVITTGRLDKKDAQFVDVIHTSGFALGYYSPLGHADFYPNKGVPIQPGCGVDVFGRCSHRRSYQLFMETISNSSMFMALPCVSWKQFMTGKCPYRWQRMGEHVQYGIEGKFYLRTANTPPYDLGYTTNAPHPVGKIKVTRTHRKFINFILNVKNKITQSRTIHNHYPIKDMRLC